MSVGHRCCIAIGICLFAFALPLRASDYPSKPIRFVVPWPAGGIVDVVA
jgi:tripartite-type tricarboxylate transporter receptor subunit TctC